MVPPLLSPLHVDHPDYEDDYDPHSLVHIADALLSPKVCAHLRGFVSPTAIATATRAAAAGAASSTSRTLTAPVLNPTIPLVVRHPPNGAHAEVFGDTGGADTGANADAGGDASKRLSIVIHGIAGPIATATMSAGGGGTICCSAGDDMTSCSRGDGGIADDSCSITTTTLSIIPARTPSAMTPWPPKSAWLSHHNHHQYQHDGGADTEEHKKKVDFSREVVVIMPASDEDYGEDEGDKAGVMGGARAEDVVRRNV